MKTFLDKFRLLAVAGGVVVGGGAWGQVVQVPNGCTVVVAGAGGTLGGFPSGFVGDGGVVVMPDPYAAGTFTFSLTPAQTLGWTLLGDINRSPLPAPIPNGVNQVVASGINAVSLGSWNKNLRTAETGTPSTNARSKGRVTIRYFLSPCNGVISFDVYKKWGPLVTTVPNVNYGPPVAGPNCWPSTNQLVAFSVDQILSDNIGDAIGVDQYYWQITNRAGADIVAIGPNSPYYMSADRSSITVDMNHPAFNAWYTAPGPSPFKVVCCYSRSYPNWDNGTGLSSPTATNCVSRGIDPAPVNPNFTFSGSPCVPVTSTSINGTYTTLPGHTYSWSSSNAGWTLVPGAGTLTVNTLGANPGTLFLTVNGPCGQNVYQYNVWRTYATSSLTTNPAPVACLSAGGTVTVEVPANMQGNPTTWTASPSGWTFVNNNAAQSSRTYTVPAGTCAGTYTFTVQATNCPSVSSSTTVRVRPANPTLTGPTCVPSGGGAIQTYNSTTPCGTTSFTWSNTLGMTGSSTTSTIGYTPVGTSNGVVQVVANGVGGCNSNAVTLTVNRTPSAPAVNLPPCVNVGLPGTATFSVASPQPGVCYSWTFPATFSSTTSVAGSIVTVPTLGNTTGSPFSASVTASNCSAPFCTPATTNFSIPVAYSTAVSAVNQATSTTVVATPGMAGYQLYNCNSTATTAMSGNTINLTNSGAGSYSVNITTLLGCVERPPCVATNFSAMATGGVGDADLHTKVLLDDGSGLLVSPIPSPGRFVLTVLREEAQGTCVIYNDAGQQMGRTKRISTGQNRLGDDGLAAGVYVLRIELNGEWFTRQIVVTRD